MMKFFAAILLMAFVSAATVDLCTKDSDCDWLAKMSGDTVYCGTISAESNGSKISVKSCVDAKECGETKTSDGVTGKVSCGFLKDYWWVLVLGTAVLLGCCIGVVCCRRRK